MGPEGWELAQNPSKYCDYNWYSDELPARKFYLFLAELGHRLRHLMTDPGPIEMIGLCEQYAEGAITEDDICDRSDECRPGQMVNRIDHLVASNLYGYIGDRYKVASRGVDEAAEAFAWVAMGTIGIGPLGVNYEELRAVRQQPLFTSTHEQTEHEWGALVRDIYGPNPFRPVTFDPNWRTSTAVALAKQMYDSRDFSAMPILADALQDAGCGNDEVLNHCRDQKGVHVRGCWVVDLVLGKS